MREPTLRGKKVIVTGAASGLGRATAELAVEQGATVALLDINEAGLKETHELLPHEAATPITTDLTDWESVQSGVAASVEALGGLDVVCNVAGWDEPGRFIEQDLDFWEKVIRINLWSVLYMYRATVPILSEQGHGTIVNVASDAGRVGSKGETVYAAAKGGVIALTKSVARELASSGVTTNCVCPGPMRTPLHEAEKISNPKLTEKLIRAIPLKRVAEPSEPAAAITFLASDAADYMTGQIVSVSGGLTMAD